MCGLRPEQTLRTGDGSSLAGERPSFASVGGSFIGFGNIVEHSRAHRSSIRVALTTLEVSREGTSLRSSPPKCQGQLSPFWWVDLGPSVVAIDDGR